MNEELFIQKYQPIYFSDFEMEDDTIISILQTFIEIDNLNIIFIADIGCGKSSLINALIKEYYKDIPNHLINENILCINNLKEHGINYYRNDVKIFCQIACSIKNKKKIIVLDDLDFINEQSQQVFRNCIDKYSHNVHFIASSNNIQKIIESLQSRLNIIKIKSMKKGNLAKIMKKIKEKEGIEIDADAENFILDISNNTVKILINYMEKIKLLNKKITLEIAMNICTNISYISFIEYTTFVKEKNDVSALQLIYSIFDKGYSVMDILDNYFQFIKTTNILTEDEKYKVIPIICKYITVFHNIHEDEIELALFTNNLIQNL
jgi:DNA polymerase III delta prime subunit